MMVYDTMKKVKSFREQIQERILLFMVQWMLTNRRPVWEMRNLSENLRDDCAKYVRKELEGVLPEFQDVKEIAEKEVDELRAWLGLQRVFVATPTPAPRERR